jgi:hypothetical protein
MLAKVIYLKKGQKHGNANCGRLLKYVGQERVDTKEFAEFAAADPTHVGIDAAASYIAREGIIEGGSFNLDGLSPNDPKQAALITQQINSIANSGALKSRSEGNPFYHYVLSWKEGEHPTKAQVEEAAKKSLKALGLQECQAIYCIHRDKAHHHHVHVVANRFHPEKLTLQGPPYKDFLVLDKTCREIELAQGWKHDNGVFEVVDGKVRKLTLEQRILIQSNSKIHGSGSQKARMLESQTGVPSFGAYCKKQVAVQMLNAKSWDDVHSIAATNNIAFKISDKNLMFQTVLNGNVTSTKSSGIHRELTLTAFESRIGRYEPPTQQTGALAPGQKSGYQKYIESVMIGKEPHAEEIPQKTGRDNSKRDASREARSEARIGLFEKFNQEKASNSQNYTHSKKTLSTKHFEEKKMLRKSFKQDRADMMPQLIKDHGKTIAQGIFAGHKLQALQDLQATQKIEKAAFDLTKNMKWEPWLEMQAATGNEAAIAALRGIRYREQRKAGKANQSGFEGEDLDFEKRLKNDQNNQIGGVLKRQVLTQQIDYQNQLIRYIDSDAVIKLVDEGSRIDVLDEIDEETIRAGLMLASEKFGGEVIITGPDDFKVKAAKLAEEMKIRVVQPEIETQAMQRDVQARKEVHREI